MMTPRLMTRQFADSPLEWRQAIAQTATLGAIVLLLTTSLPEARAYAPFTSLLLLLPLAWGTTRMRLVSVGLIIVGLVAAFQSPLATLVVAGLLGFFLGKGATSPERLSALQSSRFFSDLGQVLPEWEAFRPRDGESAAYARVLKSPHGHFYFVAFSQGKEMQRQGQSTMVWRGVTADTIRQLSRMEPPHVQKAAHVLCVRPPGGVKHRYEAALGGGVSTLFMDAPQLAQQLGEWEEMRLNRRAAAHEQQADAPGQRDRATQGQSQGANRPEESDSVWAEEGRRVEAAARAAMRQALIRLAPGWTLRENVVLLSGGDADLVLGAPNGMTFVIDVKSRRDRMNLGNSVHQGGNYAKTWQQNHDQVVQAAQQFAGIGVLWQPLANPESPQVIGQVHNVRGDIDVLVKFLCGITGTAEREESRKAGEKKAAGQERQQQAQAEERTAPPPAATRPQLTDYEILGIEPSASPEDIQKAWRELIRKYHPDKFSDPQFAAMKELAEEQTKQINAAYQRLKKK